MSIDEILAHLPVPPPGLVEVTGGEPLLQEACPNLVDRLLREGYTVLVESNGSLDIRCLPEECTCILDMKCPDSGMSERMRFENLRFLRSRDELKFVIQSRRDYLWAKRLLETHHRPPAERVLFSPAHGMIQPKHLAEWILDDNLDVRIQLPLHRLLWPGQVRGR